MKRIYKDLKDVGTRTILYRSLVLPQLEYSSQLWSPFQINHKLLLENAQRRATKFFLYYPQDLNYKQILIKLNLLSLEYCRDMLDVVFFFLKCQHGHYNLDSLTSLKKDPSLIIQLGHMIHIILLNLKVIQTIFKIHIFQGL